MMQHLRVACHVFYELQSTSCHFLSVSSLKILTLGLKPRDYLFESTFSESLITCFKFADHWAVLSLII